VKPEVLAWALLFVVVTGILYRFFAWVGRRLGGKAETASAAAAPPEAQIPPPPPMTLAPKQLVPPPARPSAPPSRMATGGFDASVAATKGTTPSAAPAAPPKISRPSVAATLAPPEPLPTSPAPAPTTQATPQPPRPALPSRPATMSPIEAAAAAAAIAMRGGASRVLAPDVNATVAPGAAKPLESAALALPKTLPPAPQFAVAQPDVRAPILPPALNGTKEVISSTAAPAAVGGNKRSTKLRARKVGEGASRLDMRIKDAQARKARTSSKATRKSAVAGASRKRLKPSTGRKALEKPPARRIGLKAEVRNLLASAKAATKIVGAPQRSLRVRITDAP